MVYNIFIKSLGILEILDQDRIWGADFAEMQLLREHIKGVRFFLCVINIYSKYVLVVPLKKKRLL